MTRVTGVVVALLLLGGAPAVAASPAPAPAGLVATHPTYAVARTAAPRVPHHLAARSMGTGSDDTVPPADYRGLPTVQARRVGVPSRVHILVLRVFWSSSPPKFPDTGQMKGLMKDTAAWFKRTSRGRQHVTSKVTPWLRVGGAGSNCVDTRGSTQRAVAAARSHGIGAGGFNRFMLVMPQCGTNSLGEMPGRVTWIKERLPHLDVLTHELGHNLGLDHANALICTAGKLRVTQVTKGGKCVGEEYGDLWDAMGISTRPYSVAVLRRLGWAGKVATTRKSGTWTLRDAEHSGNGVQGLQVQASGKASYWLEYHTTDVASAKEPGSFAITGTPGLQIRLDTGRKSLQLLDAAPGNPDGQLFYPDPDYVNATLPVGSSFTTPQRVRITLLSQDASGARVRVTFGKSARAPDAPTLVSAVAPTASQGQVELTLQPGGSDNGQVVLGYLATRFPGGKTVFVRATGGQLTHLTVSYSGGAAKQWTLRAVNQVGASAESAKVDAHVPAPVVTIVSPAPGSILPGPVVHVAVDAQPDPLSGTPVSSVSVCLDSYTCEQDAAAPWAADLEVTSGAHTITVTARDKDGNEGRATTAVTFVDAPPTVHIDSPAEGASVLLDFTVTATVTPNPASGPVESVSFVVFDSANDIAAYDTDYAAPWSGELSVPQEGTYRVEVVATDPYYSSPPAIVHVNAAP